VELPGWSANFSELAVFGSAQRKVRATDDDPYRWRAHRHEQSAAARTPWFSPSGNNVTVTKVLKPEVPFR
jgi:hypothetical protein